MFKKIICFYYHNILSLFFLSLLFLMLEFLLIVHSLYSHNIINIYNHITNLFHPPSIHEGWMFIKLFTTPMRCYSYCWWWWHFNYEYLKNLMNSINIYSRQSSSSFDVDDFPFFIAFYYHKRVIIFKNSFCFLFLIWKLDIFIRFYFLSGKQLMNMLTY